MKIRIYAFLLIFIPFKANADCSLSIRANNAPPFIVEMANNEWKGLDIELSQALLKEAGCEISYLNSSWKRGLYLLEIGALDMMSGMSLTEPRKKYTHFIGPIRYENTALIVRKDSNLVINNLNDIRKLSKRIGIVNGIYYGNAFNYKYENDKAFSSNFDVSNNSLENIKKLAANRIVGFVSDEFHMRYRFKHFEKEKAFEIHPFYINKDVVYLGFSKKSVSKENISKLEAAYKRLKSQGVFKQIENKYSSE